jgi:hypothetical protein
MGIIILATLVIWTTRNVHTYKGIRENRIECKKKFKEELTLVIDIARRKNMLFSRLGWMKGHRCRLEGGG